jgi:predicted LPLAT superfamily acyltransferase
MEDGTYTVLYNSSESVLAVELLRALQRRDWVALQADRAPAGLTVMQLPEEGKTWLLPKGPFVLAAAAGALCLPAFVQRQDHRRYRITFHAPFQLDRSAGGRDAAATRLAHDWTDLLARVVRQRPDQWLVFEPAFVAP